MLFDILSLFPDYFKGPFEQSILKNAQKKGLVQIRQTNIRDFAKGKRASVDSRPYGGGPGMVLLPQPVCEAIRAVRTEQSHVIYLSPQGMPLKAARCQELAEKRHLILLCGHYEGVDERVLKEVDEEISIGDFVLSNGCVAAIVLVDSVSRFIPGVLGHGESALRDSFQGEGFFEAPLYTRPEVFEGVAIPSVLKEGNHGKIALWKREQALDKTRRVRPELFGGINEAK